MYHHLMNQMYNAIKLQQKLKKKWNEKQAQPNPFVSSPHPYSTHH